MGSDAVRMMGRWKHHGHISTLDHSLFVAYCSYRAARALRLDETAAARAGLLHDLYLYDSRDTSAHPGWQCFDHPRAAARNAAELTALSEKERNIILSHMWPLGGQLPRSWEAWLVDLVDTLCAGLELAHIYHPGRLRERPGRRPHCVLRYLAQKQENPDFLKIFCGLWQKVRRICYNGDGREKNDFGKRTFSPLFLIFLRR